MKKRLGVLATSPVVAPEERRLAGVASGILYALAGLTLAAFLIIPGISHAHRGVVLGIAGACIGWGLCSVFAIDWASCPRWLIHVSHSAALVLVALAIAFTGGADSPAWVYLFLSAVFAAFFYSRRVAIPYLIGCVAIQALPLLYDPGAVSDAFVAQLVIATPAYLVLGGAIIVGKSMMLQMRTRAEQLAAEQSALRRVATAVVDGEPAELIYALVAREVALLVQAGAAAILRFEGNRAATVMGSWADRPGGRLEPGRPVSVKAGDDMARARDTGVPVRVDHQPQESLICQLGYEASVVAPIQVGVSAWGVLAVAADTPHFTERDENRLMAFGDLLATAIASIEDRAKLAAQASSDPLTGLANHRSLQKRLAAEVARARRHGHPLSVAVIDIDHFKQINDNGGHDMGDEILVRVATCLRKLARSEDTLARVGGDEFAWVLPEATREQALVAVERVRLEIAAADTPPFRITVSAGICDTSVTHDAAQLIRLADGALYWSKAHGRDQCWVYDPQVVNELSAEERAERLERSQALLGLRALARAIDAKDPATSRHSERVADIVAKLAKTAGWSPERAQLLSEAALVHDVGKIGIPDVVLRKTQPLTAEERLQISEHAELSARIVEEVLASEQVEWIRTHHERPDGEGYPDGLTEEEIPEGGALLALADAWDVMTASRPYSVPKSEQDALAECVSLVGQQFTAGAVGALVELYAEGELAPEELLSEPLV